MKKLLLLSTTAIFSLTQAFGQIPLAEEKVVLANERRVNSDELEFSPVFFKDGIVFTTTRNEYLLQDVKDTNMAGRNVTSIYHSLRDEEGFLSEPRPFASELLFKFHDGPVTFDNTANSIFFTRNEPMTKAPDSFYKLQVYGAKKTGEVWEEVKKLPFNNIEFNFCHPTISADNELLIIASDVPGGYGGMDLYAMRRNGEEWGQMLNLGEQVNTPGNEVFPFLSADGVLYFSSDGHGGLGNLDLMYAKSEEGLWGKPVSLSTPFNSPNDDFGFIVDAANKNGYFSSDRPGGFGGDDIYSFYIEGDVSPIAEEEESNKRNLEGFTVRDEDGQPMEGVNIAATNLGDVSLSASDDRVVKLRPGSGGGFVLDVNADGIGKTVLTRPDGSADLALDPGSYVLKVSKEGYLPEYVVVGPADDLSKKSVTLRRQRQDCVVLHGSVWSKVGGSPVAAASVTITNAATAEVVTVYTDDKGYYEYCVPCHQSYLVYATKGGRVTPSGTANLKDTGCAPGSKLFLPLYMEGSELMAGMTFELPNIYFNYDDDKLRPDAYKDLNEVVGIMRSNPDLHVELGSHTDARGEKIYNQDLSDRRSVSVFKYLSSKGVDKTRLVVKGYGESKIRNRCADGVKCSESEHQVNRRTEIRIVEIGEGGTPILAEGKSEEAETETELAEATTETERPEEGKGGQDTGTAISADPEANLEDETASEASTTERGFAVVVGTFANHDNAVRRVKLLSEMGFAAVIVQQQSNNLYAVWVDTFSEKKPAMAMMRKLAQRQLHSYLLRRN